MCVRAAERRSTVVIVLTVSGFYSGGGTGGYGERRDAARYDSSGPDDGPLADGNSGQHSHPGSDEHVILNANDAASVEVAFGRDKTEGLGISLAKLIVSDEHIGANLDIAANLNLADDVDTHVALQVDIVANDKFGSVIACIDTLHMETRLGAETRANSDVPVSLGIDGSLHHTASANLDTMAETEGGEILAETGEGSGNDGVADYHDYDSHNNSNYLAQHTADGAQHTPPQLGREAALKCRDYGAEAQILLDNSTAHLALNALDAATQYKEAENLRKHEVADLRLHLHGSVGGYAGWLILVVVIDGEDVLYVCADGVVGLSYIIDGGIVKHHGIVDEILLGSQHNMEKQRHGRHTGAGSKLLGIVTANHVGTQNVTADLDNAHTYLLKVIVGINILHGWLLGILITKEMDKAYLVALQHFEQGRKVTHTNYVARIKHPYILAAGGNGLIESIGETVVLAEVLSVTDVVERHAALEKFHGIGGAVGGIIVHNDDFDAFKHIRIKQSQLLQLVLYLQLIIACADAEGQCLAIAEC